MNFVACYLPMLDPEQKDPTRGGFNTREDAEKYIKSMICDACKKDLKQGLPSGCEAEWVIVPEDKFKEVESYEDLMEAAGYKPIYKNEKKRME